jgi:hypothetical protein
MPHPSVESPDWSPFQPPKAPEGAPNVGLRAQEPVEPFEPTPDWPISSGCGHIDLGLGAQAPLPDHVGVPALLLTISASIPFSGGIEPLAFGNPIAASVMHAIELRVWFRPVSRHDRVGEHSAVVCHWV